MTRLELAPDLLGDALCFVEAGPVEDGQELLAPEPSDEVARAQPARQDRAERPQDGVALWCPWRLLNSPKWSRSNMIAATGCRSSGSKPRPRGEQPGQRHVEVAPVPEAGQRVTDGRIGHLRMQLDVVERQRDLGAR